MTIRGSIEDTLSDESNTELPNNDNDEGTNSLTNNIDGPINQPENDGGQEDLLRASQRKTLTSSDVPI
ncbi:unnamed protein product [Acanthoscelides obtectus]|uniref:Uncharacterized protein n=1 Tax=Acanthoscelides obtectus TaxID=200917 RepID=A0A9P0Q592_ACAOB|nr:unnamed protein product [Acanthoscelides obtectus]CAK1652157.1 hypothetical protein AOBTE_LOCUS17717 [Acanthoscelides obtectus]